MSEYLPVEIVEKILSKLSVKTLLVGKSVCKRWRDIISQAEFVQSHFESAIQTKTLTRSLLLSITTNNLESLELDRISLGNRADAHILASPAALPDRDVVLLGSCNGFICACLGFDDFFIWNPSNGGYRAIPPPPLPASEFGYAADPPFRHFGGFGYVSATQDYKLVLSAYVGIVPAAEGHPEDYDTVDVQVFSLNNETWGEEITSPCFAAVEGQGVLVNQKLHWVLDYYNIDDDGEEHIIAFDLETETFQSMQLPFPSAEPTNDIDNFGVAVSSHQGNLCVWYYNKRAASVDYWIMEIYGDNDSWRRYIFNISTHPPISFLKPLMVTESAIVLVRCSTTGVLELVRIHEQGDEERAVYMNGWRSRDYQHESLMVLYDNSLLSLPPPPAGME